jgi:hypothetical protein
MSHCSSGSRTQSSSSLALFDQPVRGRDRATVLGAMIGFFFALMSTQPINAQTCSSFVLLGARPIGSFSTTANINCPGSVGLQWGDGVGTSTSADSLLDTHTYTSAGPWYVQVNGGGAAASQFLSYANLAVPMGVFSGRSGTPAIAPIAVFVVGAPMNTSVPITITCMNVIDPNGNPVTAESLNISCSSPTAMPSLSTTIDCTFNDNKVAACLPLLESGGPVPSTNTTTLDVNITPSGLGSTGIYSSVKRQRKPGSLLVPITTSILLVPLTFFGVRQRKFRSALMLSFAVALCLSLTSCGGGFIPPAGVSAETTPGTYLVTVQVSSTNPDFIQTSLIVPITVVPTQ